MANTILERIQEKYPGITDDARNIAEALGMAFGTGGRGSGAISDVMNSYINVTLDPNGGEGTVIVDRAVKEGYYKVPPCPFTPPEGKVFSVWNTSTTPGQRTKKPGDLVMVAVDFTYYAIWVDAFTITFDANSGSGTIEPIEAADGDTINLPDGSDLTAPTGKEFVGWGESALATEPVDDPYTVTDNAILYAIWDDVSAGE